MRSQLHRVLVSTGLAAAALIGTAASASAQVVRDHRQNPPPAAPPAAQPAPPAPPSAPPRQVDVGPREAPPPLREERHDPRRGYVWVNGRWDWRRADHRWSWLPGHWERERAGMRWRDPRWEAHDGVYVLVDGEWTDTPPPRYPSAAPPPLREERPGVRTGYEWTRGRWDWQNGNWQWIAGHWERERVQQRWAEGRWELRGDHWEWIDGHWAEVPKAPPLDQPPPPPQPENTRVGRGYVYLSGRWGWENGKYVWKRGQKVRAQQGMHYEQPQWVQRDGAWTLSEGRWVKDEPPAPPAPPPPPAPPVYNPPPASGPTSPPPPPREERAESRNGYVWARGHQEWRGDHYEWLPGHWERQRAQLTWYDARWEQRGNVWFFVEGGWR